jgi:hypothetical protein
LGSTWELANKSKGEKERVSPNSHKKPRKGVPITAKENLGVQNDEKRTMQPRILPKYANKKENFVYTK